MNPSTNHFHPQRTLSRQDVLHLIRFAYSSEEFLFAAQVALDWLTDFPGDLPMRFWYANARVKAGHLALGATILDEVLQQDPEYIEALQARLEIEQQLSQNHSLASRSPIGKSSYSLSDYQEWLFALKGHEALTAKRPYRHLEARWGEELYPLRKSLTKLSTSPDDSFSQEFQNQINAILAAKPDHPLVAITHLRGLYLSYQSGHLPLPALRQLVEHYRRAFPNCLYIGYVAVEVLLENGENEQAVANLHSLAARDLTAQVARRLWSSEHPFLEIFPKQLEKQLTVPIPASLAARLGWNQLPWQASTMPMTQTNRVAKVMEQSPKTPPAEKSNGRSNPPVESIETPQSHRPIDSPNFSITEDLRQIQETFNQIGTRLKQPNTINIDGRQPVYVAMSNKARLIQYYGHEYAEEIAHAILELLEAIQAQKGWRGVLYWVDEGLSLSNKKNGLQIDAIQQTDPWAIKRGLQQLDNLLAKQGEMIGALLIVGAHEIIPFHRLPNPLEDDDPEVYSDNPYGSRDENYLVMDWPVGRLPCSVRSPQDLLQLLRNLSVPYRRSKQSKGYAKSLAPIWSWVNYLLSLFRSPTYHFSAFGYTAAAWRFASFAVFRQIGNPQSMLISPQLVKKLSSAETAKRRLVRHAKVLDTLEEIQPKVQAETQTALSRTEQLHLPSATVGYFNLHGLADSPEWFGQSDPTESDGNLVATSDHPIALQPGDILLNPLASFEFIFSEACFGAYIFEKDISNSLALAFLSKGCRAFVGSTSTSYGSNGTPLIAADFLAFEYWKNLRQGLPAGESLRQAKLTMARELTKTDRYLDGEGQKTLTSFVLYGDPLAQVNPTLTTPKVMRHTKSFTPNVLSTCDHALKPQAAQELSPHMESLVKKLVAQHLPGMEFDKVEVLSESRECPQSCSACHRQDLEANSPSYSDNAKGKQQPSRKIIILRREEQRKGHHFTRYARLTLDEKGRLIKIAVSR